MTEELENQLKDKMLAACKICYEELNYRPTRFLEMLHKAGPIWTAINLISRSEPSDGFTRLWEMERLDLSIENIILIEKYRELFDEDVIEQAKARLEEYGYYA